MKQKAPARIKIEKPAERISDNRFALCRFYLLNMRSEGLGDLHSVFCSEHFDGIDVKNGLDFFQLSPEGNLPFRSQLVEADYIGLSL